MSAYKVQEVMKTVVMNGRNGCHQIHDAPPNGVGGGMDFFLTAVRPAGEGKQQG